MLPQNLPLFRHDLPSTGDGGFDLQEPSSLAGSPTPTVRFFLTSQHLLSITKKYMLVLDTCPLRNLPFPCAD